MCQSIQKPPSFTVTTEQATSATIAQWNRRVGRSQTRTGADTAVRAAYGTTACSSSFLTALTRSSRLTPRYMAIAAATNTDE
jgi:hypothetical protein